MRHRIIMFLKTHPIVLDAFWKLFGCVLNVIGFFIPSKEKTILFSSFGGRSFDDSPKALYDEICSRHNFDDWELIWAFVEPGNFDLPRGNKVKIDTFSFFKVLLTSKVWISNSGMSRGIRIDKKDIIRIETWHGTPLKRIGGEENQNSMIKKKNRASRALDRETIRCAQSEYDREIFERIFNASQDSFLLCDLPRNDALLKYADNEIKKIRKDLCIGDEKKVILYTPTYREYLIDNNSDVYIAPPIDFEKWERVLGREYVLLIRAHYAVNKALGIKDSTFIKDVSNYPNLNDLYAISDTMISDYSSTFFDFSILDKPMFCFAYDLDEYMEKRGLYLDLEKTLPCSIDIDEDTLLKHITEMDVQQCVNRTKDFHAKFAPYAGKASEVVVNEITERTFER